MSRRLLLLLGCVFVAACADSPTTAKPAGPQLDGGWTIGSGGRADTTSAPPTSSSNGGETLCVASESGGWTIGSGGVRQTQDQCGAP
jgi:hypothetical protein